MTAKRGRHHIYCWLLALLMSVGVVGCGRTELVRYSPDRPDASVVDAGRDAGGDAGFDAGIDAGIDAGCLDRPVPMTPAFPTVMLVIDRSGSMVDNLDGTDAGMGASRWEILQRSLSTVLPPLDQQLALGAIIYPAENTLRCDLPSGSDLVPARGNVNPLLDLMRRTSPTGGTPTAAVLGIASQTLLNTPTASSARALVLATDGAPNCNTALNPSTCVCTSPPTTPGVNCGSDTLCLDDTQTINTITATFRDERIPTYVIGIGSQLNQWAGPLDRMAVAGGAPRMGTPRYYSVANQNELTDAFTRITAQLTRCTFLVNGVGPNEPLTVRVNGVDVAQGPNGWEWTNVARTELVLHGVSCDQVAMGSTASALVECAP